MRDRHPETERTELAGRSVRSRGRASGGGLVSHISRRSTRTAPSHCWIDLLEIKAPAPPAQRPCGRRCRAVLAPPTAGRGSGTKGLPPPGAPETEQPRRPAVASGLDDARLPAPVQGCRGAGDRVPLPAPHLRDVAARRGHAGDGGLQASRPLGAVVHAGSVLAHRGGSSSPLRCMVSEISAPA